jgi:hypothetical protein
LGKQLLLLGLSDRRNDTHGEVVEGTDIPMPGSGYGSHITGVQDLYQRTRGCDGTPGRNQLEHQGIAGRNPLNLTNVDYGIQVDIPVEHLRLKQPGNATRTEKSLDEGHIAG